MADNPYSTPGETAGMNRPAIRATERRSRLFFLTASFGGAWVTFYAAYSAIVFSTPYLEQHMVVTLFTAWFWESIVTSLVVTAISAATFVVGTNVRLQSYLVLAVLCMIEFSIVFWFFVAFFGV